MDSNIRRYWKVVIYALRHPGKLHSIIRNSYIGIGHIKYDARVDVFKVLKEKTSNRSDWKIGVVNKPSY